jgi:arsenite methyltransferase
MPVTTAAVSSCRKLSRVVEYVIGVDMTARQLDVAVRYRDYHRDRFGHAKSNVSFHNGYIEKLDELPLEPDSFDIVVSNCVINLSEDKAAVLAGAYRALKTGGELYFADVYSDRRVPAEVASDPVLYGECLGGALYWNDFVELAKAAGFHDPRLVSDRPIEITDPQILAAAGGVRFFSATYRLFKLPQLEAACEDYGQTVTYKGSIPHHAEQLTLDKHHIQSTGEPFAVCGNTFDMLHESRLRGHFEFSGDRTSHAGIFPDCGTSLPFDTDGSAATGSCC